MVTIQCVVNMRTLCSKVKVSSGTNSASPESKVQIIHFLRELCILVLLVGRSGEKSPGFSKRSLGRTGTELGKVRS